MQHLREHKTRRTLRFPGSLVYYTVYGGYLIVLALLGQLTQPERTPAIVKRMRWTDLFAFLSWIVGHVGLPKSVALVLEARLLGSVGIIEPRISEFLRTFSGRIFVDVGAYHGHYSLLLEQHFDEIISVEPVPANADVFHRILSYRKSRKIRIVQAAIGASEGRRELHVMPWLCESRLRPSLGETGIPISVEMKRLDTLLRQYDEVDLVKVDVEGAEFEVLEGAKDSIKKIRCWLIELHDHESRARLESFMKSSGYGLTWIDEGHLFAFRR